MVSVIDDMADDPEGFGEKGDRLLDKLEKTQRDRGNPANEAQKAIDEIAEWANEGELDPVIAEEAISALEQLTGPD